MKRTPSYTSTDKAPVSVYIAATIVIFFLALSAADSVGFVPCYMDGTCTQRENADSSRTAVDAHANTSSTDITEQITAAPERIRISSIALDLPVQNPETTDLEELDIILRDGPARFAPSAELGQNGTMIIFAHSSHLPVVRNQMYRAFNRVPELKRGDTITLDGGGKSFLYSVASVKQVDVHDADATIDLSPERGTHLTLVTCDTLTGKSARFVVEAELVGTVATP